jgi:predicted metalloprotease with PDZ domain
MRAGLSAGDVLLAMDGLRIGESSWKSRLARRSPGDRVSIHAFRRDELLTFDIELESPRQEVVKLEVLTSGTRAEGSEADSLLRRTAWLGNMATTVS